MVLVKNDTYWDADTVKLEKINMTNVKEFATQAQLFEGQELDISGAQTDYLINGLNKQKQVNSK